MKWDKIIKVGIFTAVFYLTLQPPLDLDLGWHLRYGQYFFETGHVLKDNIISFVWPHYQWVQASWGFDVLLYQIYTHLGLLGISIVGALLTTLIFFLAVYPMHQHPLVLLFLAMVFLSIGSPLYASAFRSQTLSTLFFIIALIMTDRYFQPEKIKSSIMDKLVYLLPIVFLVWANMHGGFSLGLIFLILIWGVWGILMATKNILHFSWDLVPVRKWVIFGIVLIASCMTPLLNPWGTRIYEETFKHSTNTNLTVIVEWMSLTNFWLATLVTTIVCLIALAVFILRKKIQNLPYIIALLVATYLAFSALRFLIILGVMLTYFLAQNIQGIRISIFRNRLIQIGVTVVLIAIIVIDAAKFRVYFAPMWPWDVPKDWHSLCRLSLECSEGLAVAISTDPPDGNGYNPYNIGGFLAWRTPQVKTFVDGRMAAWEENGKTPPVVEADWVIMQKNPVAWRKFDSEYHFSWAVVPTETYIADYLDELVKNKLWQRRYRDELYSLYVKNQ